MHGHPTGPRGVPREEAGVTHVRAAPATAGRTEDVDARQAATRIGRRGGGAPPRRTPASHLGTGYPGTPSTEILEAFSELGGRAQWAPNEKVALEVGLGAAFAGARALVTMKHVGLNVAADPLFTAAYTGVTGRAGGRLGRRSGHGLQPERAGQPPLRRGRRRADARAVRLAGSLRLHAARAIEISERWQLPVLLRMTTRVCHSKTHRGAAAAPLPPRRAPHFERDIPGRVMIPAYARPAHRRLREKLAEIAAWNETVGAQRVERRRRRRPGHHHLRHLLPARPRGGARGERAQARDDLPAAARAHPRLRRQRRALRGHRRRRSLPGRRASAPRASRSRASRRCTASAS